MRRLIAFAFAAIVAGCATLAPWPLQPGRFDGAVTVQWVGQNRFVFNPGLGPRFSFTTRDSGDLPATTITPGLMYTDGGSVPQFLWGIDNLSPWDYGPAYIIHDWLFDLHHCGLDPASAGISPPRPIGFEESARILGEAVATLMAERSVEVDEATRRAIVAAVNTPAARRLWENGTCEPVSTADRARLGIGTVVTESARRAPQAALPSAPVVYQRAF